MRTTEILKRCEVFLGLHDSELQNIVDLPSCREEAYEAQEIIFKAGEEAKHFYVLKEGRVNLVLKLPTHSSQLPNQTIVTTTTIGGSFGWPALVPLHVFTLSAICQEPSKVIVISGKELRILFDKEPHIGFEVLKSLVRVIGTRFRMLEQLLTTGKTSPLLK